MSKTFTSILIIFSVLFIYSSKVSGDVKSHKDKHTLELNNNKEQKEMSFLEESVSDWKFKIFKKDLSNSKLIIEGRTISPDDAKKFVEIIEAEDSSTIESVRIFDNKISEESLVKIFNAFKTQTNLKDIFITRNYFSNKGAKAIASFIKDSTCIKTLDLSQNKIEDDGVKDIAQALIGNKANQLEIELDGNHIEDDGAVALAQVIKNKHVNFRLSENQKTDVCEVLAEDLKKNKYVNLSLLENNITDAGAIALAESVKDNPFIENLSLAANEIGIEGAQALAEALKNYNKSPTFNISLFNNNITESEFEEIFKGLKGKVYYF